MKFQKKYIFAQTIFAHFLGIVSKILKDGKIPTNSP